MRIFIINLAINVSVTGVKSDATGGKAMLAIPLLERCAFTAVLQVSRFADLKLPPLRLGLTLPLLHFHISPARLQRLMRVINAAVPSKPSQANPTHFLSLPHNITWRICPRLEGHGLINNLINTFRIIK